MRLGGWYAAQSIEELEPLCDDLDCHGLSAIGAPYGMPGWPDEQCAAFGERARELGIVVGEIGLWDNLMTRDADKRANLIATVRTMLAKAEIAGCRCVVTLIGSDDPSGSALAPTPYMFSDQAKAEFREIVLRILDGMELTRTAYGIEPWHNTFFYQPEDIREFIDSVGHPSFGLHLDQMNMVTHAGYFDTTGLINRTFDLLADKAVSVHMKDVRCDDSYVFLKLDEVYIGDGVMDYETFLRRLPELPADISCFCEHLMTREDYAHNFARVRHLARKVGVEFLTRSGTGL